MKSLQMPPEKIFLQWWGDGEPEESTPTDPAFEVTWCVNKIFDHDIKYHREKHWVSVEERLPKVGKQKPPDQSWAVTDGVNWWKTTLHPSAWNVLLKSGEFFQITHWMEITLPEADDE